MKLLYKYYGFSAGLAALEFGTLGFSDPRNFNDPMEGRLWLHQNNLAPNELDSFLGVLGILCMTPDPENALMWSHYGDNHQGFAIGYSIDDPLFGKQRDTVIPANTGRVFNAPEFEFSDLKSSSLQAMQWTQMGMDAPIDNEAKQALRHMLLMKQSCWQYEQEVRVVKLLSCAACTQSDWVKCTGNNPLPISELIAPHMALAHASNIKTLKASNGTIKSIVLGMRNPLLSSNPSDIEVSEALQKKISAYNAKTNVTVWDRTGELRTDLLSREIGWGWPRTITSTKLNPDQLRAISPLIANNNALEENLTVTRFKSGETKAYWESELHNNSNA